MGPAPQRIAREHETCCTEGFQFRLCQLWAQALADANRLADVDHGLLCHLPRFIRGAVQESIKLAGVLADLRISLADRRQRLHDAFRHSCLECAIRNAVKLLKRCFVLSCVVGTISVVEYATAL